MKILIIFSTINELINHYKFIDKQKQIQEEYKDLPKKKEKKLSNFKLVDENKLMMKNQK